MVPLTHWVIRGSGDVGVPVVPTCGCWSSFRVWLSLSSLLGVHSHPFGACLLGAGRRLPVVVLFACSYRVVGWRASFWAAGVICGGVAGMTWHVGNMEGACSPGDVGVWLSGLVGHLSWFVGSVGCWSWWRLLVGGWWRGVVMVVEVVVVG